MPGTMSAIGAFAGVGGVVIRAGGTRGSASSTSARVTPAAGPLMVKRGGSSARGLGCRVGWLGGSSLVGCSATAVVLKTSERVARRGLRVVARAGGAEAGGSTRLSSGIGGITGALRGQIRKNFNKLPSALISLLVGFSMTAYFPHPESPGDAAICFTIIFLCEFLSSVLYSPKRPRGLLKFLKMGTLIPLVLNCFKIGVLYGLCCDAFKVGS